MIVRKLANGSLKRRMNGMKWILRVELMEQSFVVGVLKAHPCLLEQGTRFELIIFRIILVGKLTPSAEKWKRIICGGGGNVAVTNSTLSGEVRSLVESDGDNLGLRICVIPESFTKNGLVDYVLQWGYSCVPSTYVGIYSNHDI